MPGSYPQESSTPHETQVIHSKITSPRHCKDHWGRTFKRATPMACRYYDYLVICRYFMSSPSLQNAISCGMKNVARVFTLADAGMSKIPAVMSSDFRISRIYCEHP